MHTYAYICILYTYAYKFYKKMYHTMQEIVIISQVSVIVLLPEVIPGYLIWKAVSSK